MTASGSTCQSVLVQDLYADALDAQEQRAGSLVQSVMAQYVSGSRQRLNEGSPGGTMA